MIIGVMKGGTTALFSLLMKHPSMRDALMLNGEEPTGWNLKEAKFFDDDRKFSKLGYKYYVHRYSPLSIPTVNMIDGSPGYIFDLNAAPRIYDAFGDTHDMKFIVTLREPVSRMYSEHRFLYGGSNYLPTSSFQDQVISQLNDAEQCISGMDSPTTNQIWTDCFPDRIHSYLARSLYDMQIEHFMRFYPQQHFYCIVSGDRMLKNMTHVAHIVSSFIGLTPFDWSLVEANGISTNANGPESHEQVPLDEATRDRLQAFLDKYSPVYWKKVHANGFYGCRQSIRGGK